MRYTPAKRKAKRVTKKREAGDSPRLHSYAMYAVKKLMMRTIIIQETGTSVCCPSFSNPSFE
jgi:hypothetical protein